MTVAETLYRCDCCVHALVVEKGDDDWNRGEWSFAIWEWVPYGGRLSWRQRFQYIKQVLRWGKPYGEHVILKQAEATRLALQLLDAPEGTMWTQQATTATGTATFTTRQGRTA